MSRVRGAADVGPCASGVGGSRRSGRVSGWTMLELVFACSLMLVVVGVVLQLVSGSDVAFRTQPEQADLQQRLRVAVDMMAADLRRAGTGLSSGPGAGSLFRLLPAVRLARRGLWRPDPELASLSDRFTTIAVESSRAQARLAESVRSTYGTLRLETSPPGCPGGGSCGLATGSRTLILDIGGPGRGYDIFSVSRAGRGSIAIAPPNPPLSRRYSKETAWLAGVVQHTYYHDVAAERLMRYDGYRSDLPLIEGVVGFAVTLFADPDPSSVPPPAAGESSCVYAAGTPPVPLLRDLGGTAPQPLTSARLSDGPVCGVPPNRFDGDLLRVRRVRVQIVVRVASDELRRSGTGEASGPGQLGGRAFVVDRSVTFDVAPRAAVGGRPAALAKPDL